MFLNKHFICTAIALCSFAGVVTASSSEGKIIGDLDGQILSTGAGRVVLLDSTGKELWTTKAKNCHDVWKLDNGNVLIADGEIREINPATNKLVFKYTPATGHKNGAYSCQRLENGNTVVGENVTGRILELDQAGKIVFELATKPFKKGNHHNLRMVRKLDNGNYLVCHSGAKIVREYTPKGDIVFEVKVNNLAFSAVRLPNGNTVVGDISQVLEFDTSGQQVWKLEAKELKDFKIGKITGVNVLPNGNMVIGIYGAKHTENGAAILEVTRDKKVVWRYIKLLKGDRTMMSAQKLDSSGKALSLLR